MNTYLFKKFLTIIAEKYHNMLIKFNSKKDNHIFEETFKNLFLNLLKQIKLILLISSFHNIYTTAN